MGLEYGVAVRAVVASVARKLGRHGEDRFDEASQPCGAQRPFQAVAHLLEFGKVGDAHHRDVMMDAVGSGRPRPGRNTPAVLDQLVIHSDSVEVREDGRVARETDGRTAAGPLRPETVGEQCHNARRSNPVHLVEVNLKIVRPAVRAQKCQVGDRSQLPWSREGSAQARPAENKKWSG